MTEVQTIRVLIADDQPMVRAGIKVMLEASGMTVVAEAENGRDAVALANEHRPDVCLMDIRMPGMDGLEATRQLAGSHVANPLAVVVVTTFDQDDYVHQPIHNGASGFILKDAGPNLLIEAVRAALGGAVIDYARRSTDVDAVVDLGVRLGADDSRTWFAAAEAWVDGERLDDTVGRSFTGERTAERTVNGPEDAWLGVADTIAEATASWERMLRASETG